MRLPPARATIVLVVVTAFMWLVVSVSDLTQAIAPRAGFIPARVWGAFVPDALPVWITPLTATLVHDGLLHIGFNLLMLGYCGRFVEAALGPRLLLLLYLIGAYAAAAGQFAVAPHGEVVMIGASGAISALVGAYALLYGQNRVRARNRRLGQAVHIAWLLAAWVVVQTLLGLASRSGGTPIATAAHVGGFAAGVLLAHPFLRWRYRGA